MSRDTLGKAACEGKQGLIWKVALGLDPPSSTEGNGGQASDTMCGNLVPRLDHCEVFLYCLDGPWDGPRNPGLCASLWGG